MRNLFLIFLGVVLVGCSAGNHLVEKPAVIEKSTDHSDRPDWVMETFAEKDGMFYFSGMVDGGHDLAVTLRQAKAEAMKNVAESIATSIRQEFAEVVEGDNQEDDLARWMSDGIAWAVRNINVIGAKQREVYYERIFYPMMGDATYTAFARIEMSKPDYMKSRRDALKKLRGKLVAENQKEAKERAEELLDKLLIEEL
jgi:hypothetical protein